MADRSAIQWTDATWNPVTGCSKVSPGCAHCYAETFAERWRGIPGHPYEQGFDLRLWPQRLDVPLRWKKPRMVFVNSMSDLFHEDIPDEFIAEVFAVMAIASQHTFQVLTKRPERMRDLLKSWRFCKLTMEAIMRHDARWGPNLFILADDINEQGFGTLTNVWAGVTIENRRFVHRADILRQTPAAVRFISAEPLLGPLVIDHQYVIDDPFGRYTAGQQCWADRYEGPGLDLTGIDWLIAGGESGPRARRVDPQWVRDLRDACIDPWREDEHGNLRGTAFFFKQWGGRTPKSGGRELDGRTWDEMPERTAVVA